MRFKLFATIVCHRRRRRRRRRHQRVCVYVSTGAHLARVANDDGGGTVVVMVVCFVLLVFTAERIQRCDVGYITLICSIPNRAHIT